MQKQGSQGTFTDQEMNGYIQCVLQFLDIARDETLAFWNNPTPTEIKEDLSPVTALDRKLEMLFREEIGKRFPGHGVIGEEYGNSNLASEFQWIVDPIDGTMNLVERVPTFGIMIALAYRGYPILGAIDHPVINVRHYGGEQVGVFNGEGIKLAPYTPSTKSIKSAMIGAAAPGTFAKAKAEGLLSKLVLELPQLRIYYDCFAHSMGIAGGIMANIDYGLKIWDLAAAMALVRGRKGVVYEIGTPWNGDPDTRLSMIMGQQPVVQQLYDLVQTLTAAPN